MRNVIIASAVRTPGGSFGGSLKDIDAATLGALVIKEAAARAALAPDEAGQVIMGCGWQAGAGPNPARIAAIEAGLAESTPAFTVNIRCASSLRAVQLGVLSVAAGEEDIVLAGGMESTSNVPYYAEGARWGVRMGDAKLTDGLAKDGFHCRMAGMLMGATAELLVEKYNISREEQDGFALASQQKACAAVNSGAFAEEILAVEVSQKRQTRMFDTDEIPRPDTSMEKLARLAPVFKKGGSVTAGSSSALCDGAAAVVLMAEEAAKARGISGLARVAGFSYAALDPKYMGLGPVPAVKKVLHKTGLTLADIDIIELNEAFAAQVIACANELSLPMDRLNIRGGAIALGHPVGATGAKILTTLLYALKAEQKRWGLVTLCVGGGQGVAMIVENLCL
jgi:acetyl-CoA C-acetyltransferase